MDLWIRNADKTLLLKANEIAVRPIAISSGMHGQVMCRDLVDYDSELNNNEKLEFAVYVNDLVCGTYSTKEKALKVLDKIQKFINHWGADQVYQMPADER